MKRTPTDLEIFNSIYNRYYETFSSFEEDPSSRESKNFVPTDIEAIAKDLKVDVDIIFGRLYYHLEDKYGYIGQNGARVHFFAQNMGSDRHVINFPFLGSILANLRQEDRKFRIATTLAIVALFVSGIALLFSIFQ